MIPGPDWDAPAGERLSVVLVRPDEEWTGLRGVVQDLGAAAAGDAALSARHQRIEIRDRVGGAIVASLDVGATTLSADYGMGLAQERLETWSLARFVAEYSIDPAQFDRVVMRAFVGIGSNLGDRLEYLQGAVDGLAASDGVEVVEVSGVYETDPVGPEQPDYLNAVVAVDTTLTPRGLLEVGQRLEAEAERVRKERWGPRTLDVDILLFGDENVNEPDLVIPHPRWWERDFVLAPLADLGYPDVPEREWTGVRPTGLTLRVP